MKTWKTFIISAAFILTAMILPAYADTTPPAPSWPPELDFIKTEAGGIQSKGDFQYLAAIDQIVPTVNVGGKIAVSPAGAICVPEKVKCSFELDTADFISKAMSAAASSALGSGAIQNIKVESVHYIVTFWDKSRIILPEKTPKQEMVFPFPTDPEVACVVVPIVFFTYDVHDMLDVKNRWSYFVVKPSISIIVIDQTQPEEVYFDPPALLGTTGDKVSEFNQRADAWGFQSQRNPPSTTHPDPDIMILVRDNNYFSNSKTPGFNHGKHPPNIAVYVEVFETNYTRVAADTPNMPKIEKMLGERVDESKFAGRTKATPDGAFRWYGPIWMDTDLPNWKFDIVPAENKNGQIDTNIELENGCVKNKDKICSVLVFKGPFSDIEAAMESKLKISSRLSDHFASRAGMGFLDQTVYDAHFMKDGSDPKLGDHYTRICVLAIDSSCNCKLPFFFANNASAEMMKPLNDKYGSDLKVVRSETTGGRVEALAVIPYDDSPPNPILSVTNTETNKTTVFTIPNSDLCDENWTETYACPYAPYQIPSDTYYFKYDNTTDTMKWLEAHDKTRYQNYVDALQINEDVRLIFDMMAYDNINKHVEVNATGSMKVGQYGIVTPMYGMEKNDDNLLRFITWKINDPTGPDNLKYEDQAQGIFVYPDYIFRNPDTSIYAGNTDINKSYFVSFFVEDNSPFYNRASAAPGQKTNRRTILLEFKVSGKRTSSRSMGTSTLTMSGSGGLSGQAQPK